MTKIAICEFDDFANEVHIPLIKAVDELDLGVIITSASEQVKKNYPEFKVYESLNDETISEVDLFILNSITKENENLIPYLIEKKKHVILNNPYVLDKKYFKQIMDLAKRNEIYLGTFNIKRLDGDFLTVKNLIHSAQLGEINYFESNFNLKTIEEHKNLFYELAGDLIDQTVDIFGPPEKVLLDFGQRHSSLVPDKYFHIILKYERGQVHLNGTVDRKIESDRFIIHGTKGSFVKKGKDRQRANLKHGMPVLSSELGKDQEAFHGVLVTQTTKKVKTIEGQYKKYYKNLKEVLNKQNQPLSNIYETFLVVEIMDLCLESYKKQKWIDVEL